MSMKKLKRKKNGKNIFKSIKRICLEMIKLKSLKEFLIIVIWTLITY